MEAITNILKRRNKMGKERLKSISLYILTLLFVVIAVGPFIWSLSTSLKTMGEIYATPPTLFPRTPIIGNYLDVFETMNFGRIFLNSVIVTSSTIVITIVLSLLGGYGFSRFRFPMRGLLLMLILIPRIIPSVTRVIPLYQLFSKIGILDTYISLIAPYVADATPIGIWILIGFFDGIPKELEEAAMVDGCTRFQALVRVIIPLTLPGVVTVALFAFIRAWNEFVLAFTFIGSEDMMTLPVAHYRVFELFGVRHWGAINAYTMLAVLPIMIFFLFFEKRMVKGMTAGSVKG